MDKSKTSQGYELSIVVPTYNEQANIDELVKRLSHCLDSITWELIVVDDNSEDGTAEYVNQLHHKYPNIRSILRIGRRGLSSACLEGVLASTASIVAIMDADLQHDEQLLPQMFHCLYSQQEVNLVVGSRYIDNASTGSLSPKRVTISKLSNWIGNKILSTPLSDPMSGFFMIRKSVIVKNYQRLSKMGYKILLDICATDKSIQCVELPYRMRQRHSGESKLDVLVSWEYFLLILDKTLGQIIPLRFLSFVSVGLTGLSVHLCVLYSLLAITNISFGYAQGLSTLVAITNNYYWNNIFTYRDQRLTGNIFWRGLLSFYVACTLGVIININIATMLASYGAIWWLSGSLGAMIGAVWNFAISRYFTWMNR